MIKDRRFLMKFDVEPSMADRLSGFLAPYDCRIYSSNGCYVDLGSGSLGVLERLTNLIMPAGSSGCMATVGRWCEFASTSEVMGRAAHANDQPVNVGLGGLQPFSPGVFGTGLKPFVPIKIGHGVVISSGARVLPGVSVGNGAVIGANAVVRSDVEPNAIVAGSPAREVKKRPAFQPWWDFSVDYLLKNLPNIQAVAASEAPHEWRTDRPRFVLQNTGPGYTVTGFSDGEAVRPLRDAPAQVQAYINQAMTPGTRDVYWVPDCWAD